jgi:cytochrome c oxidase subunit 1
MSISSPLKKIILIELLVPISLLVIGIYHGLMQTIYRSGVIHQSSALHLDYYQGLTLHGVINAIVLTTFFAVAFGHATIAFYLKKEPRKTAARISLAFMVLGTLMAAAAMLSGKASVLYTFYPPLKASPLFYLGTALLIVGSWIPLFDWLVLYRAWKRENPGMKIPLAVLGTLVNFIIWFVCTLAVAYEVLVLLVPWSFGWVAGVNVSLARTLFWFFGHALVYFWLLPAYIMFYTMLPKLAGGKLYSDTAGRISFLLFLLLSIPVGVHHQFSDPNISQSSKLTTTLLTFGVALPSFITAFTLAASLEYAGRARGAKGLFGWFGRLPYLDPERYLFGYLIAGLILFIFGGLTGIVNASYSLNAVVHNTAWIPGHFHMTVAGPVFLAIIGMSLHLVSTLKGKKVFWPRINVIIPYLWMIGIFIFSTGLMWGGLIGEPRRTNLGLTYLNPASGQFHPAWVPTTLLALSGGVIMTLAGLLYFIVFFGTFFSKTLAVPTLQFPVSESYHDEKYVPLLNSLRPWIIVMIIVIAIGYIPPVLDVLRNSGPLAPPHLPGNPMPGI